jgi:N-acyl amino acid synthase of PEP-CTERM/exosortase system
MTIGLIRDLIRMSVEYGVTHWCAVMMPSLLRLLGRLGIHFAPAGPLVEYHGKRQPCYRECGDLLEQVRVEQPEVWAFLTDEGRIWPPLERRRSAAGG